MSIIDQVFRLNHGINQSTLSAIEKSRKDLFGDAQDFPLLLSNDTEADIEKIQEVANNINANFKNLVVLGTGASESIPKIFFGLGNSKLNVEFLSNVDQYCVDRVLSGLYPKETAVLVITKSGKTVEIIALLAYLLEWFEGEKASDNFFFITELKESPIYSIAKSIGAQIIKHDEIGGRFAVFTAVGLLPAALAGFNIAKIIKHASVYFKKAIKPDSYVVRGVEYAYEMSSKFLNNVFMSYGDRFDGVNLWVRQLVAESLGKDSKGITPLVSRGIVDHHSQLQLYLDGPDDKFFTVLYVNNDTNHQAFKISKNYAETAGLHYMSGLSFNNVMDAQMSLSIDELVKHDKNVRVISTSEVNEEFISEFIMSTMLEVVLYAYAFDINPFGQPAVEKIKENFEKYVREANEL